MEIDRKTTGREITESSSEREKNKFISGSFIAAVHDEHWYTGKITAVIKGPDGSDEYEVTFMETAKANFRWPKKEDEIFVPEDMIICGIEEPQPLAKSGRIYKTDTNDRTKIDNLFDCFS